MLAYISIVQVVQELPLKKMCAESWGQVFHCANNFSYYYKRQLLCTMKDLTLIFQNVFPEKLQTITVGFDGAPGV